LSARYEINRNKDGTSYHFIISSGNTYIAYFTEFTLQDEIGTEVQALIFGFSCKLANEEKPQRYDIKIRTTIIYIVKEFFGTQPKDTILFLCMNRDGKAKNRHITFKRLKSVKHVYCRKHVINNVLFVEFVPHESKLIRY